MPNQIQPSQLTLAEQALVDLAIERAEQACRYAAKHVSDRMEADAEREAFELGCEISENAIREHVMRHIAEDLEEFRTSAIPPPETSSVAS